jgi:mannose-6-phosphate isomerase-like protein (cupin superfamily)
MNTVPLNEQTAPAIVFKLVEEQLKSSGLKIAQSDFERPWGGFFVVEEDQADLFIQLYFPKHKLADFTGFNKLSPKILIVAPYKRLSWQYHFRRAEIWRLIAGRAGVITSQDDNEQPLRILEINDEVNLNQGERHRLIGIDSWGIVAEIWQHTDPSNPSDENDIVRLQDDYGR